MEILEFFQIINQLKQKQRQGWKDIGIDDPRDTIASHSLGAALIGWKLAENRGIDSDRTVKMLLVHDLIMAFLPDLTPEDPEYSEKKQLEEEKKDELADHLPEEIRNEAIELFEEFREWSTEESKTAHEADKLDTLMQSFIYSKELGKNDLESFLQSYKDDFRTAEGKEILDQVEKLSRSLES